MVRQFKIVVEKHADGYVAYPLGLKGVVVGEGDSYEEALADVRSAINFHIETFGTELENDSPCSGSVCGRDGGSGVKFPEDAPIRRVIKAFERLGFE